MTVKQLKDELEKFDNDMTVLVERTRPEGAVSINGVSKDTFTIFSKIGANKKGYVLLTTKKGDVKQKLLDKLSEEPLMVLSTAYAYAKNYVNYGEDITKAWTSSVQQASILEQVKIKAQMEAYDSFKEDYENRLKTDMVAMLDGIRAEINTMSGDIETIVDALEIIDKYKAESEE